MCPADRLVNPKGHGPIAKFTTGPEEELQRICLKNLTHWLPRLPPTLLLDEPDFFFDEGGVFGLVEVFLAGLDFLGLTLALLEPVLPEDLRFSTFGAGFDEEPLLPDLILPPDLRFEELLPDFLRVIVVEPDFRLPLL